MSTRTETAPSAETANHDRRVPVIHRFTRTDLHLRYEEGLPVPALCGQWFRGMKGPRTWAWKQVPHVECALCNAIYEEDPDIVNH